jgi:hypothetical protein
MRKWIIAACVVVALCTVGLLVLLIVTRRVSPVNAASAARVQVGMTQAEVAAIFGGPPGDYRVGSRAMDFDVGLAPLPGNTLQRWRGDDGLALIQFGPDGRVIHAEFIPPPEMSLLDRLLDMLGL